MNKILTTCALLVTLFTMTAVSAAETRKERLMNFYDALGSAQVEKLDKIIVKNWVTHDPNPGQEQGREGFKKFIQKKIHTVVSDVQWQVEEMVEEGNTIVVRSIMTAKHTGPLLGVKPTGKVFTIKAIDIHHFNDKGMVVETYHLEDWIAYLAQVGALGK